MINADGILVVGAKELRSGVQQSIEVKPQHGLTDAEVEKILSDSIHHAKDDMEQRALVEAKTEGNILIATTQSFLQKNKSLMSKEEIEETNNAIIALEKLLANGSKDKIQQAIETLNTISRPYAERIMDEVIGVAMKGKKIS
jgi:molecular chaperone HscA